MHHPVLITLFGVILHPAIGQNNSTSEPNTSTDERCIRPTRGNDVPVFCADLGFYSSNEGYFNGSRINSLRNAMRSIFGTLDMLTSNSECVESVQQYLCYYYFPPCNIQTGQIYPVCDSSCRVLFNHDNCLSLIAIGYQEFMLHNISERFLPNESCSSTYRPYANPVSVSSECEEIEVSLPNNGDTLSNTSMDNASTENNDTPGGINVTNIVIGVVIAIVAALVIILIIAVLIVRAKFGRKIEERNLNVPEDERYIEVGQHSLGSAIVLGANEGAQLSEVNQLLHYVEKSFSDILISEENVIKMELIGKGAFGMVHKGELRSSNSGGSKKSVAIKSIRSGSLDAMKDLVSESSIMKTFDHPNVLPLLGVCIDYDDEDILKIVIPFMTNGDVRTFLKNNRVTPNNTCEFSKNISEQILISMCLDIARGMEYLAEKRFVHRDLAARNCMVDEKLAIKVADFGLTRDIYSAEYYRIEKHAMLPVKWMSPESLLDGYFDEKTDVWSYGVTCWEIFSLGRIPYPGVDNADIISLLKHGKRLDKPELCPSLMFEMIKTAWLADSKDRPSFAIIVQIIQGIIVSLDIITHQEAYKGCQHHNIQNALMDETETTFIDVTNDGSYLDLLNSH